MELNEVYWNNKWPKHPIIYAGRALRGQEERIGVDVRNFIKADDLIIKDVVNRYGLKGRSYDETVWNVQKFVVKFLRYKTDENNNKCPEFWQFPFETIQSGVGDCIANYEEIYTEEGIKQVKDLELGDRVLSYDFSHKRFTYKPIVKIWEKGLKTIHRVHFRNGTFLDLSEDHKLLIQTAQKNYEEIRVKNIDLTQLCTVPLFIKDDLSETSISHIEKLDKTEMRDFEVAETHNFVTRQGVIISNCEDGAILTVNLSIAAGVPNWRMKVAAGTVKPDVHAPEGGHAWAIYLASDGEWRNIDWCFYQDSHLPIIKKPLSRTGGQMNSYKEIWFTFNDQYSWSGGPMNILSPRVSNTKQINEAVETSEYLEKIADFVNSKLV